jgi:chemosensory pili system protein ChpC
MAEVVLEDLSELSCVLIPLQGTQLLLPNISVAEILSWRRVKMLKDAPVWCLGLLGWRGEAIPVVRFEALNDDAETERKTGRCIVVMNRAHCAQGLPFYAIAANSMPRMVQLTASDIRGTPGESGPAELVTVHLGAETAVVPNLEYIESAIAGLQTG